MTTPTPDPIAPDPIAPDLTPPDVTTPDLTAPPTASTEPKRAARSDYAPLYAVAGLTDVVFTSVRQTLEQVQERASERIASLRGRPGELERQATSNAAELRHLLRSGAGQAKALPEATKARITELQRQLQSYLEEAGLTYDELAGRGKRAVDDTLVTARTRAERPPKVDAAGVVVAESVATEPVVDVTPEENLEVIEPEVLDAELADVAPELATDPDHTVPR